MKGFNVWNIMEYDTNKLICSTWNDANIYLIDRNESVTKPTCIVDPDKKNDHCTDLTPITGFDPQKFPFFVKRSAKRVSLIDIITHCQYELYKDANTKWGYCKLGLVDK